MSGREEKPYYKIGEVCELTGTQPYVLRFWESEFPNLAPQKNRTGQRVYRRRDIDLIQRIKTLLYEKEYTIAGARKVLDAEARQEEAGFDSEGGEAFASAGGEALGPAGGADGGSRQAKAGRGTQGGISAGGASYAAGGSHPAGSLAGGGRSATGGRDSSEDVAPRLPLQGAHGADLHLEAEVKNLRAKLARAEAELKEILSEMSRHDES